MDDGRAGNNMDGPVKDSRSVARTVFQDERRNYRGFRAVRVHFRENCSDRNMGYGPGSLFR